MSTPDTVNGPRIVGIDHVVLTVRDIDRTCDFYSCVLGLRPIKFDGDRTALRFGDQKINLHLVSGFDGLVARDARPGTADICFVIEGSLDALLARLRAMEIEVLTGPVQRTGALGPMMSVYLRDPDGNLVEVASYGVGRGRIASRTTLGLDLILRSCTVLAIGLLLAGTSSPGRAQGEDDLARQVSAAEARFAASMADRDFAAFAAHVADDAIFFGSTTVQRGKAAVLETWRPFFADQEAPFSWAPETVEVLSTGTLAFSSGPIRDPGGRQVGTFNSIWRLDPDGRWRVIFDKGCAVDDGSRDP